MCRLEIVAWLSFTVFGIAALNLALLENDAVAPFKRNPAGELNIALSASICRYCMCDVHAASVTCNSERRMRLKVVSLPSWTETFRAHNLSLSELPHFAYHARLKTVRVNYCALERVQPDALASLPALETLDLANNMLTKLPNTLLTNASRLRTLILAHNRLQYLDAFQQRGRDNFLLDELTLSGNPLRGACRELHWAWLAARRLRLDAANVHRLNATHIAFERTDNISTQCQSVLRIPTYFMHKLELLDLSDNLVLHIDSTALSAWTNITSLALRRVETLPNKLLDWIQLPITRLRHLDLNGARFALPLRAWHNYCGAQLAWLDISGMALEELELDSGCGIQWLYANNNQLVHVKIQQRNNGTLPLRTLHLDNNRLTRWPLALTDEDVNFLHNGEGMEAARQNFYEIARPGTNKLQKRAKHRQSAFDAFGAIEELSLANNLIRGEILCASLTVLPTLTYLNLANNRIDSICSEMNMDFRDYNMNIGLNLNSLITAKEEINDDFNKIEIGTKLTFLNVSGNILRDLTTIPRLKSLAVLDASRNVLDIVDICALLRRLPRLQHLHLAENSHLGRDESLKTECTWHRTPIGAQLVDVDLSNCALRNIPDLRNFLRLSALNLAGNLLRSIDASYLPSCITTLDASENRVEVVNNFNDAQLACLRHLRLARNSLHCSCSVQMYASVLQREDEFYDRTEYYCFTTDGWQHPLNAYLDANAQSCAEAESDDASQPKYYQNASAVMLSSAVNAARLLGIALLTCLSISTMTFLVVRVIRTATAFGRMSPVAYKLIAHTEAPVNL